MNPTALLQEFEHEVVGTRRVLEAIPEKDINYKPSQQCWTMGELAQHIATIYYWYDGVFGQDEYDLANDHLERSAASDIKATRELFESNVIKARKALEAVSKEDLGKLWTMKIGGKVILDPMPRAAVVRGVLFNHLYHHRGEMIVYLRATGNKVPGLYGPTAEEMGKGG